MSRELFNLACKKINESDYQADLFIEGGPTIGKVETLKPYKPMPSLAVCHWRNVENNLEAFYFQVKDFLGFSIVADDNEELPDDD